MTKDEIMSLAHEVCNVGAKTNIRGRDAAEARVIAAYFLYWALNMKIEDIADAIGRSLGTIYHSIRPYAINERRKYDAQFRERFDRVAGVVRANNRLQKISGGGRL